jgi:hypothetical protein
MMQVMKDIGGVELPETLADLAGKAKPVEPIRRPAVPDNGG